MSGSSTSNQEIDLASDSILADEDIQKKLDRGSTPKRFTLYRSSAQNITPTPWHYCPCLSGTDTSGLDVLVSIVVVLNAITLGLETDMAAQKFTFLEYGFSSFFILECAIKLRWNGVAYLKEIWNIFDCLLAVLSVVDMFIIQIFVKSTSYSALIPLIRLLRLSRVLRIMRLFRFVHRLELIVQAFLKSTGAVVWICLLLFIFNYICAIFLTHTVGHHASIWSDDRDEEVVRNLFGDVLTSMRTLFVIMTMDGWFEIAETMSEHISPMIVFLFMASYIMISEYTMMSMVTGCISEALVTQQQQTEKKKLEKLEAGKASLLSDLLELWKSLDEDNSGTLDYNEVHEAFTHNPDLLANLALHDVHVDMQGLEDLYVRLQDPSGEVAIESYVDALSKMTGYASASSVFELKHGLMLVQSKQIAECHKTRKNFDHIVNVMQNCCSQKTDDSDVLTRVQGDLLALGSKFDAINFQWQELFSKQLALANQQEASQQDATERLENFIIQHRVHETTINQRLDVIATRQQDLQLSMTTKLDALIEYLVERRQKQSSVHVQHSESLSAPAENAELSRGSGLMARFKQDARMDSPFAPQIFPQEMLSVPNPAVSASDLHEIATSLS